MAEYYCPWCGGYLYEELQKTGKYAYETAKRVGCGRPWCPGPGGRGSLQKQLDEYIAKRGRSWSEMQAEARRRIEIKRELLRRGIRFDPKESTESLLKKLREVMA